MRKSRSVHKKRISEEEITTLSVSKSVRDAVNTLTDALNLRYTNQTGKRLGLIANDTIKFLLNSIEFDNVNIKKFDLDFEKILEK